MGALALVEPGSPATAMAGPGHVTVHDGPGEERRRDRRHRQHEGREVDNRGGEHREERGGAAQEIEVEVVQGAFG